MDQATLSYNRLIENHLEHLKREYRHRLIDDATLPQFWFLTVTFLPVEAKRDDQIPIPPHRCFVFFERFYVRLVSRLMNNFERKRWLQPLTFLYIDYPFTKREKTFATLSPIEQFHANPFHFYPEHPETTPHIHAIMLVAPQLVERFEAIRASLANLFQSLGAANCTLRTASLQTRDDLRRAIFYSSKLLKRPPRSLSDIDLYTVLPKAKSEPVYVKSDWERELEAALRESRASSANV
ncbi:MAG: hypothetical protein WA884_15000 [Methyloceanibacter sp.]